jgi:hypothetical protein
MAHYDEHPNSAKSKESVLYILCIYYSNPYYWLVLPSPYTLILIALIDFVINLYEMLPYLYIMKLAVYYVKISHLYKCLLPQIFI